MSDTVTAGVLPEPLGLAAFDRFDTETEPWFDSVFVKPDNYQAIIEPGSVLVFGDSGIGKSMVREALVRQLHDASGYPTRLLVFWRPNPQIEIPAGSAGVKNQLYAIWDECAITMLQHLAIYPERWDSLPDWARHTLSWFAQKYIQGDVNTRIGLLRDRGTPEARSVLDALTTHPVDAVLWSRARFDQVFAEFVKALGELDLHGVWVIADNLEEDAAYFREELIGFLLAFLSALSLFERPNQTVYKLFLPSSIEADLLDASGRNRRRIDRRQIEWTRELLTTMLEKRFQVATGNPDFAFADFCTAEAMLPWFENAVGLNPREWLELVRPFARYYFAQPDPAPLTADKWELVVEENMPSFVLDAQTRSIFIGERKIASEELPVDGYDVLAYLYDKKGTIVSREELYYCACLKMSTIPQSPQDKGYENKHNYQGKMDTLIYRLRQIIEPDPSNPVLLTTIRRRGLRLNVRW